MINGWKFYDLFYGEHDFDADTMLAAIQIDDPTKKQLMESLTYSLMGLTGLKRKNSQYESPWVS